MNIKARLNNRLFITILGLKMKNGLQAKVSIAYVIVLFHFRDHSSIDISNETTGLILKQDLANYQSLKARYI